MLQLLRRRLRLRLRRLQRLLRRRRLLLLLLQLRLRLWLQLRLLQALLAAQRPLKQQGRRRVPARLLLAWLQLRARGWGTSGAPRLRAPSHLALPAKCLQSRLPVWRAPQPRH